MVKIRMNTADVAAQVKCLRKLIGMRCSNVYDLSPKTYMFKLMKSSGVTESGESEKILLLVESGVRLHTTVFVRDKSTTPSGFTLKLRKHIRTRRLEDVRQLGMDRVVDFQFGLGENAHHIILELYAQGNLLLTDSNYTVLTLLRTHRDDERGMTMMPHHCYPVNMCRSFERTSFEKLQTIFSNATKSEAEGLFQDMGAEAGLDTQATSSTEKDARRDKTKRWETSSEQSGSGKRVNDGSKSGKKATFKAILGESLGYGPALCEHIILDAGLQPNMKVEAHKDILQALASSFANFEGWLQEVITGESVPEGYIIMRKDIPGKKEGFPDEERQSGQVYDEFSPLLLHQFKSRNFIKLGTSDESMDEFFSKIESQRADQQQKAQEQSATQKLNKIRLDQENRVQSLKKEVDYSIHMAELIEYNLEDVDAAILAVRAALASGMDWKGLVRMVKEEKKAGNPIAGLIHSLQLEKNCITLLLSNNLDDMDEEEKTRPVDKVEVDLALSAYANARRWFETKKKQASKQEKTVAAHAKAFKAAEKKTQQQLSQAKTVAAISHIRKVHWFEKFNWFISSENYLVISGRDAQQNELIVKRYMNKGDLYVHAELHGASSTVIKNHNPDHPIPPLTLNQAGCFTVCNSQAWDSKIVTSAWWVHSHQVSKTAPTGEYLTVGSFMIRGKKNFLPPHTLVMGFGILFRMDESSLGSHINERRVKSENENQENDREEKETHEARLMLGSDGYDNERLSEQDSSTDDEVIADSNLTKDIVNVCREENYAESGDHNKISVFSTSMKGNGIPGALAKGQQDTDFSLADYKEASGKDRVEDMVDQNLSELEELMDKALGLGSVKLSGKEQSSKYGLEVYQTAAEARNINEIDHPSKPSQREKPYLSKAERKKLKKGTKDGAESSINQETNEKCLETENLGSRPQQPETVSTDEKQDMTAPSGKVGRGRRGKLKKIKEKYAEQDEEERQLRMALLASAGKGSKDIESKREKEVVATAKGVLQTAGEADITKICYKCKKPGHVARECPDSIEERNELVMDLSQPLSVGRTTVESEANLGRTTLTENERLAFQEDDIHELGEDEKEKLTELDTLTGIPLPNDILLYAVPVCGPYNALQAYKFHVKITPGTAKKGKAAKTAINLFTHMQDATTREKELMKALNEPELVAAMIGNAKIVAPGLTQLKQRQKKGKKSSPQI
jgi:predicted ribosome quality control (RQC) complex YloA/Tae2 family protein